MVCGCKVDQEPKAPAAIVLPPAEPAPSASSAVSARTFDAKHVALDGIKLGDLYASTVKTRKPYDEPCDDDAIDNDNRRFMIYGAKECRNRVFPEETTLAIYIAYAKGHEKFEQPVQAIAWLGGNYFATRSDFPMRVGDPVAKAQETFGASTKTFSVERKKQSFTVEQHAGDVYVIIDNAHIVGFVVGAMPDDPQNEQWRALMQAYVRYTKPKKD